jgi:hypothetical protein
LSSTFPLLRLGLIEVLQTNHPLAQARSLPFHGLLRSLPSDAGDLDDYPPLQQPDHQDQTNGRVDVNQDVRADELDLEME